MVSKYPSHVLSAYSSRDDNSKRDKLVWVNKNMRELSRNRINIVKRQDKQKFAVDMPAECNLGFILFTVFFNSIFSYQFVY